MPFFHLLLYNKSLQNLKQQFIAHHDSVDQHSGRFFRWSFQGSLMWLQSSDSLIGSGQSRWIHSHIWLLVLAIHWDTIVLLSWLYISQQVILGILTSQWSQSSKKASPNAKTLIKSLIPLHTFTHIPLDKASHMAKLRGHV